MRRLVIWTGAVLVLLLLAVRLVGTPLLRPPLGYLAKVTCSQVFVGGLSPDAAVAELPDLAILRVVRMAVDVEAQSARAAIPGVATRTAVAREGLGCILVPTGGEIAPLPGMPPRPEPAEAAGRLWPDGDLVVPIVSAELDTARLRQALDRAFAEPGSGQRATRAVVVVHHGRIVAERYAEGFGPATRFPGWSMTKSVGATLVGILVGEGKLTLDAASLFPEWAGDARAGITLRHLLQMSDGLAHDETYGPSGGATRLLFGSRDVAATAATTPLRHEPGRTWYYASAASNLISRLVREASGTTTLEQLSFPRRALFERIGMRSAVMEPDATGTFVASSFMYATARDWARFGLLFLRDGMWHGERVLPAGWVSFSVTPAPAAPQGQYGAQWWLNAGAAEDTVRRPFRSLPRGFYRAAGYEGQMVGIVPSADLVIVRLGLSRPDGAFDLEELVGEVVGAVGAR